MDDPWKAKQWLREMDLIFDTIECSDQEKYRMATFQLTYATTDRWESKRATLGEETIRGMVWATFKVKFLEKYFPITERNHNRMEFLELIQGNMTVREYMTKFECLSLFYWESTPGVSAQRKEQVQFKIFI